MGIDRPDDNDTAATDRPADQAGPADQDRIPDRTYPAEVDDWAVPVDRASLPDRMPASSFRDATVLAAETRDRAEYYAELHATAAGSFVAGEQASDARDSWDGAAARFTDQWAEHERRWPSPERPPATPPDQPGSWRGDGGRALDATANKEVERGCERIGEIERDIITPAMRQIEAAEPGRELAGLDHRLKGEDRLKEKVADQIEARPGLTTAQALSAVPDAVRFTFCYREDRYSDCVRADLGRLHSQGFELVKPLKNSWASEQYKGINSQWRDAETGQRFEVQFHTEASLEAKQLTHAAYERIRNPVTSDAELDELEDFQHRVSAKIPAPPGANEIEDYPWKET